jgi:hypothetical protein
MNHAIVKNSSWEDFSFSGVIWFEFSPRLRLLHWCYLWSYSERCAVIVIELRH